MIRSAARGSRPRVLSIAGTDPTGGAGIHADLKSIAAMGGYGMAVVTALVAQNTQGVRSIHTPPIEFLREQLLSVSDDVVIDAVKIGMLGDAQVTAVVAEWLEAVKPPFVVLDPVMVASSGDRLLQAEAEDAVRELAQLADVVTPNLPELEVLTRTPRSDGERTTEDYLEVAATFAREAGAAVVVKGGHAGGETVADYLVTGTEAAPLAFTAPRIDTRHTHGTGCSLSAALATAGVNAPTLADAFGVVHPWLHGAIERGAALQVGQGNGPIDHGWMASPVE